MRTDIRKLISELQEKKHSNPVYLSTLVFRALSEGGPPKDGGVGSGNWIRHTSNNPVFNSIIQRDIERKEKEKSDKEFEDLFSLLTGGDILSDLHNADSSPTSSTKSPISTPRKPPSYPQTLKGWEIINREEDSPERRLQKETHNLKLVARDVARKVSADLLSIKDTTFQIAVVDDLEFSQLRGRDDRTGVPAFCDRSKHPPLVVFSDITAREMSGEDENTTADRYKVLAHELLHALPESRKDDLPALLSVSLPKSELDSTFTIPIETELALGRVQDAEGRKYSRSQLEKLSWLRDELSTHGANSLEDLFSRVKEIGIDPEDLKRGTSEDPFSNLKSSSPIKVNLEEAVTELLARKFTLENVPTADSKRLSDSMTSYHDDSLVLAGNMLEKHGGDKKSAFEDLKQARNGDIPSVQSWANSLKYGVEALNSEKVYKHMMTSALKHGVISATEFDSIKGSYSKEELNARLKESEQAFPKWFSKEEKTSRLTAEEKTLRGIKVRRDYDLESKILHWFLER